MKDTANRHKLFFPPMFQIETTLVFTWNFDILNPYRFASESAFYLRTCHACGCKLSDTLKRFIWITKNNSTMKLEGSLFCHSFNAACLYIVAISSLVGYSLQERISRDTEDQAMASIYLTCLNLFSYFCDKNLSMWYKHTDWANTLSLREILGED